MDRNYAIERWRVPLLGIVMALFAEIGLTEGGTVERVSKPLYRFILSRLRTAESAARRLIIAAARDIVVEPGPERPVSAKPKTSVKDKTKPDGEGKTKAKRKRGPLFNLFDALKRHGRRFKKERRGPEPRITFIDYDPRIPEFLRAQFMAPASVPAAPVVEEKVDDGTVNAKHLIRRLHAIVDALRDIPRHARRYARWRDKPYEERHPQRRSALRFGRPPGFRQRSIHEVDDILKECHWLAQNAEQQLDTS
ncbi:MAG: hypothetical protein JNJ53_08600 [Rhizobiales bacterium]|nr:hypothetical protein [Hyphomicrobiales bacterium]